MKCKIIFASIMMMSVVLHADINDDFFHSVNVQDNVHVQSLIKNKFIKDVNIVDKDGNTALIIAAFQTNYDLVSMLLGFKADKTIKNNNGKTALDAAQDEKNKIEGIINRSNSENEKAALRNKLTRNAKIIDLLK